MEVNSDDAWLRRFGEVTSESFSNKRNTESTTTDLAIVQSPEKSVLAWTLDVWIRTVHSANNGDSGMDEDVDVVCDGDREDSSLLILLNLEAM